MTVTASQMLPLGTAAPNFCLSDTKGRIISLSDFEDAPAFLAIFMCNHCPFVRHILHELLKLIKQYQAKGVAVVGISSNDITNYPEDSPEMMLKAARDFDFTFPYLYDQTQAVARAYSAACTPDFLLFDKNKKLVYRGQMDDSRPGNDIPVTGSDLRAALDAVLESRPVSKDQKPSTGCNIKWKPENKPDYAR